MVKPKTQQQQDEEAKERNKEEKKEEKKEKKKEKKKETRKLTKEEKRKIKEEERKKKKEEERIRKEKEEKERKEEEERQYQEEVKKEEEERKRRKEFVSNLSKKGRRGGRKWEEERKQKEEKKEEEEKGEGLTPPLTEQTVEDFLENQKKLSTDEPVPYKAYAFFSSILQLYVLKENKNDCAVPSSTPANRSEDDIVFTIEGKNKMISLSKDDLKNIYTSYERCKKKGHILVIPFVIGTGNSRHANMIIINYHRNEIERFEPHGQKTGSRHIDSEKIDKDIDKKLVQALNKNHKTNFKFVSAVDICPTEKSFQAYEQFARRKRVVKKNVVIEDPAGYCMAWSYFYSFLRIKFPKVSGSELLKKSFDILSTDPDTLRQFIRGQISFLTKFLNDGVRKNFMKDLLKATRYGDVVKLREELTEFIEKEYIKYTK